MRTVDSRSELTTLAKMLGERTASIVADVMITRKSGRFGNRR